MASKLAALPIAGAAPLPPSDFTGNQKTKALQKGKAMQAGCECQPYKQSTRLIIAASAGFAAWAAVIMAAVAIF